MNNSIADENSNVHKTKKVNLSEDRISKSYGLFQQDKIKRILDIGCADGGFLTLFPDRIEKHGVDLHRHDLLPVNICFKAYDAGQGLPYSNGLFDAVFAGEVIEHILDTSFFLSECHRILAPGGQIVLTTPNSAYYGNFIKWLLARQFYWLDFDVNQNGHVRYFSPDALLTQLRKLDFRILSVKSARDPFMENRIIYASRRRILAKVTTSLLQFTSKNIISLFPLRGGDLIVKAEKI